jgi:hypothetical protein|tara:strand:+ start:417 stop:626 length:210 start_codon:yes stop_codon:yes gene_type:complete
MKISELKALIRELIKTGLEEASVQGTGTSITVGSSEAYATPRAFRGKGKKAKNRGVEQSKRLGYIPVKK